MKTLRFLTPEGETSVKTLGFLTPQRGTSVKTRGFLTPQRETSVKTRGFLTPENGTSVKTRGFLTPQSGTSVKTRGFLMPQRPPQEAPGGLPRAPGRNVSNYYTSGVDSLTFSGSCASPHFGGPDDHVLDISPWWLGHVGFSRPRAGQA